MRTDIEKRLAEKEEDFEGTRRNHQRAMESMQASLDAEIKGRQDSMKTKKKLEQEISEMEAKLDQTQRLKSEADKNISRMQLQIQDLNIEVTC